MTSNDIVQKLWNLCDVLRDDGINYSDYVTELVLILFIKMEYEQAQSNTGFTHKLPEGCRWSDLIGKSGFTLLNDYKQILLDLSKSEDKLISAIYVDAQTSLREPKHLEQLVKSIDSIDWFSAKQDGLGDLYEGLLEKNASETKSGAGQYFTPRPLIDAIVECIKPQAGETVQDPAAGTAGFLIAADAYIKKQTNKYYDLKIKDKEFQEKRAFIGMELVPSTRRLALMNCLLHGIEGGEDGVVHLGNTLGDAGKDLPKVKIILTNPPFGTAKGGGGPTRDDFTYTTSNKQLAFLQHIYRGLKPGGRAAVVLPDNVLFEAGIGNDIRRDLMNKCNLHTILRLPTGIFYAQGVKTNVLFFTRGTSENPKQEENCTTKVWVYDLRTNMPSFGKRTPFGKQHLEPFVKLYGENAEGTSKRIEGDWSFTKENIERTSETSRWKCFERSWIRDQKNDSLDISWIKDEDSVDASTLPEPEILASEAMSELAEALKGINDLMISLGSIDEAKTQRELLSSMLGLEGKE
jgi:type I restriction enzyme M protein